MTWLFNQPADFAKEMVSGFVAANAALVRQVSGGVVRNTQSRVNTVAVVIGGGSGHYPAFAGLVGQGLAHGAAMGNLFASPSAQQICSVARAANNGAGVLLTFGNYAGDVLHFGLACEQLRAEGIPCEVLPVTDDVFSAGDDECHKRRGVAGGLVVFKVAAAAAERGYSLKDVLAVAQRANDCTRSIGVAFAGCTMPGADQPLFILPGGHLGLGMGIHGEPGIREIPIPPAEELADIMLRPLLASIPAQAGNKVGVIVNGLGSVKYEALFVFWHNVQQKLALQPYQISDVQVGEFITSLDMAGLSLTLSWFDDELEMLWKAPAYTPALRIGTAIAHLPLATVEQAQSVTTGVSKGSKASCQVATDVVTILEAMMVTITDNVSVLGDLDAIAGDGDHGIGMTRGIQAAHLACIDAYQQGAGAGAVLQSAADAWADVAGGTSGAIWGIILNTVGTTLGNDNKPDGHCIALAISRASEAVMHFGKARPGDKTLVDTLQPFSDALHRGVNNGLSLPDAWHAATLVALDSAEQTAQLIPKVGRARPLAERSRGTPDPGAISLAMIIQTVDKYWRA